MGVVETMVGGGVGVGLVTADKRVKPLLWSPFGIFSYGLGVFS